MKLGAIVFTMFLACTCTTVFAQWQWTDKNGRKVFSDRAPPNNTPLGNVQRHQSGHALPTTIVVPIDSSTAPTTVPAIASLPAATNQTGVEKEPPSKKKQVAEAATAQRKREEEKLLQAKVENCTRAKEAQATLRSGMRIARTNAAGDKEILDDASRALELHRVEGIMDTECK